MAQESDAVFTALETILPATSRPSLSRSVIPSLLLCIRDIASALRASQHVSLVGTANAFGDDQLNVDVLAEQIIRKKITGCASIIAASSEEDPNEVVVGDDATAEREGFEKYTIAFDPLDGSSIIASNWTVGTIIGLWDGPSALHQSPNAKQVASILGVYGPRTSAIVAWRLEGVGSACFEVGLSDQVPSLCEIIRTQVSLLEPPFKTRYFAPANLRAAAEDEQYCKLVTQFIRDKYTLRYSGGLVPDIVHALVKGHGIYISPVTTVSKAKLRRLYELAPIALITECAGGSALDPATGETMLSRHIEDCDERAGLICGTSEEVALVRKAFDL